MTNEKPTKPVCRICGHDGGDLNGADVHDLCLLASTRCDCGAEELHECICWTRCDWCDEVLPWDLWEQHWFACESRAAETFQPFAAAA